MYNNNIKVEKEKKLAQGNIFGVVLRGRSAQNQQSGPTWLCN
jgi:hypothetical protein